MSFLKTNRTVSGRSTSREGHRIAKELLQSLGDVDETSIDVPLSSIMASHSYSHHLGGHDDDDATEAFTEDEDDLSGDDFPEDENHKKVVPSIDSKFDDSLDTTQNNMINKTWNLESDDGRILKDVCNDGGKSQTVSTLKTGSGGDGCIEDGEESSLLKNNHQPLLRRGGTVESDRNADDGGTSTDEDGESEVNVSYGFS